MADDLHETLHYILQKHGYKRPRASKDRSLYRHDDGHEVKLIDGGKHWVYKNHQSGGMGHTGSGHKELSEHLKFMHGSQHSEQFVEFGSIMSGQGWKKQTVQGGIHTYAHPKQAGHVIHHNVSTGAWEHQDAKGKVIKRGQTPKQIVAHMAGHFGLAVNQQRSQHEEEQFAESHNSLKKYGWYRETIDPTGNAVYLHKKKPGHKILARTSGWSHNQDEPKGKSSLRGFGGNSELEEYLRKLHGSQHSESLQYAETIPEQAPGNLHVHYAPASISPPMQFHEDEIEQFNEDVHSVLIKHGYKKHKAITGRYYNGDHIVHLDHTGRNWKYKDHGSGGMGLSGSGVKELDEHLKHMHRGE